MKKLAKLNEKATFRPIILQKKEALRLPMQKAIWNLIRLGYIYEK